MKKLLLLSLFISTISFSQTSGNIIEDGRKIVNDISYILEMKATGKLVFEIAVNRDGKITSCKLNKVESTVRSSRYMIETKNRIITELKFEEGNGFPTFHQGRVTIVSFSE